MPFLSIRRTAALVTRRRTQRFSLSTQKRRYCRFGRNRRLVLLLAWETLFPTIGPLPEGQHEITVAVSDRVGRGASALSRFVIDFKFGDLSPIELGFARTLQATDSTQYLALVSGLARLSKDRRLVENLLAARDSFQMLEVLKQVELRTANVPGSTRSKH